MKAHELTYIVLQPQSTNVLLILIFLPKYTKKKTDVVSINNITASDLYLFTNLTNTFTVRMFEVICVV